MTTIELILRVAQDLVGLRNRLNSNQGFCGKFVQIVQGLVSPLTSAVEAGHLDRSHEVPTLDDFYRFLDRDARSYVSNYTGDDTFSSQPFRPNMEAEFLEMEKKLSRFCDPIKELLSNVSSVGDVQVNLADVHLQLSAEQSDGDGGQQTVSEGRVGAHASSDAERPPIITEDRHGTSMSSDESAAIHGLVSTTTETRAILLHTHDTLRFTVEPTVLEMYSLLQQKSNDISMIVQSNNECREEIRRLVALLRSSPETTRAPSTHSATTTTEDTTQDSDTEAVTQNTGDDETKDANDPPTGSQNPRFTTQARQINLNDIVGASGDGTFGRFPQIGHGASSTVYRGTFRGLPVALKKVHPQKVSERRFVREVEVSWRIRHPYISLCYGYNLKERTIVLQLSAASLTDMMYARETDKMADVPIHLKELMKSLLFRLNLCRQIVNALAYLHYMGIIHCDIKPGNILLHFDGSIRIMDFGCSVALDLNSLQSTTTGVRGTYSYLAPEANREDLYNEATDTYSASIVMNEVLTLRAPFEESMPLYEFFAKLNSDCTFRPVLFGSENAPALSDEESLSEKAIEGLQEILVNGWHSTPGKRATPYDMSEKILNSLAMKELKDKKPQWVTDALSAAKAAAAEEPTLPTFSTTTLKCVATYNQGNKSVFTVLGLPRQQVACGLSGNDATMFVLDLQNGGCLQTFSGHKGTILAATRLPNDCIATASYDKTVMIFSLDTGTVVHKLQGHGGPVTAVVVGKDQTLITGSWDNSVRVWNWSTGEFIKSFSKTKLSVFSLAALANGCVAVGSTNGIVRIVKLDREDPEIVREFQAHDSPVLGMVETADKRLVTCSWNKSICVWKAESYEHEKKLVGHTDQVLSLALLSNDQLASASKDGSVRVWDLVHGTQVAILKDHRNGVQAVAEVEGWGLVTGSRDKTVKSWA